MEMKLKQKKSWNQQTLNVVVSKLLMKIKWAHENIMIGTKSNETS